MTSTLIVFNSFLFILTLLFLVVIHRTDEGRKVERTILLLIAEGCILFLSSLLYPVDGFFKIQLLAWGVFLHLPLFITASSIILRKENRIFSIVLFLSAFLIVIVTVDAFYLEPQKLEVSQYNLYSSKLDHPLKIVLLADIQTDQPGPYEAEVFALTAKEDPDLILLAGDYLQISDSIKYHSAVDEFRKILEGAELDPPLGMYAVRGNVDHEDWEALFSGLGIKVIQETQTMDLGPASLTGISWRDSENPGLVVSGTDSYHIVLGHSPNFSLGDIKGDLLLAGHTHGGQFQLPGIGPILTLSAVPRKWASGLTEIQTGQYLLVSRGIGLERGYSPRMRFLCRPELVIINLEPVQ